MTAQILQEELKGLEIGSWVKPRGGYFISFNAMPGCAKANVDKCKQLGVVLTGAGATYPYGKDPEDSNIRIAPSFPTPEEMAEATNENGGQVYGESHILCNLFSVKAIEEISKNT